MSTMQRMAPGIFGGDLAMYPSEDGKYVRLDDALVAIQAARALVHAVPAVPEGMALVPKDALEMLLHKFERAGGPWRVAQLGVEFGAASWASNVENALTALAAAPQPPAGQQDRGEAEKYRALLVEWLDGTYDSSDFLRRVKLACGTGLKRATASEATAAQQDGWMPIETAPKDGTEIMLYAPVQEFNGTPTPERVTVGHWLHYEGGTIEHRDLDGHWIGQDDTEGYDGWLSWDGGFTEENPPTRWMPLPSAPANGEGAG